MNKKNTYYCKICKLEYKYIGSFKGIKTPTDDVERERWSNSCGESLFRTTRICPRHFTRAEFIQEPCKNKTAILKPDALPGPLRINLDLSPLLNEPKKMEIPLDGNKLDDIFRDIPTKKNSPKIKNICCICKKSKELDKASLYGLPQNEKIRKMWCEKLGKNLSPGTQICAKHFLPKDFNINDKQVILKDKAIPSQYLETSCSLKPHETEKEPADVNKSNKPFSDVPIQKSSLTIQNICCICKKSKEFDKASLYGLPQNEKFRKMWCEKLGKNLSPGTQICSKHFLPKDFNITNRQVILKDEAIPSVSLQTSCTLKPPEVLFLNPLAEIEHIDLSNDISKGNNDVEGNIKPIAVEKTKICSKNFLPKDFNITNRQVILKDKAKPSLSLQTSCTLKPPEVQFSNPLAEIEQVPVTKMKLPPKLKPRKRNYIKNNVKPLHNENKITFEFEDTSNNANKSVQTDVGYIRTCGYIEVSYDFTIFNMNCFYCEDSFPIWSWGEFVTHVQDVHKRDEEKLRMEYIETNQMEKSTKPLEEDIDKETNQTLSKQQKNSKTNSKQDKISRKKSTLMASKKDAVITNYEPFTYEENEIEVSEEEFLGFNSSADVDSTTEIDEDSLEKKEHNVERVKTNKFKENEQNEIDITEVDNADITEVSDALSDFHPSPDVDRTIETDEEPSKKKEYKEQRVKVKRSVPCYICEKLFKSEAHLKAHEIRCHKNENEILIKEKKKRREFDSHCSFCNKTLKNQASMNKHMLLHRPPTLKCPTCGKMFRHRESFKAHIKMHKNQHDYVCELCGATFLRISRLVDHKQRHHSKRNQSCGICEFIGKTSTELGMHRKRFHLVLEGTVEDLDMRSYGKRITYLMVEDPITKKQRYKCNLCDSAYAHIAGLSRHRISDHGIRKRKSTKRAKKTPRKKSNLAKNDCFTSLNDTDFDNAVAEDIIVYEENVSDKEILDEETLDEDFCELLDYKETISTRINNAIIEFE